MFSPIMTVRYLRIPKWSNIVLVHVYNIALCAEFGTFRDIFTLRATLSSFHVPESISFSEAWLHRPEVFWWGEAIGSSTSLCPYKMP
jgi:hypothetical protein